MPKETEETIGLVVTFLLLVVFQLCGAGTVLPLGYAYDRYQILVKKEVHQQRRRDLVDDHKTC